jgi:transposase-like protein
MPKIFESIMEFADYFATEEACWKYLKNIRWPQGFICPVCGEKKHTFINTRRKWECAKGHQVSITTDTVMHNTKLPLKKWFWAAYFVATQTPGISAYQLARKINVCYETAYMILHRLRIGTINPERTKLSGVVQIDETTVGGEGKGERGRAYTAEKSIVIGAVELKHERFGRIRMRRIRNYKGKTLIDFVKSHVVKGSTVITDGFVGYAGLGKAGYRHVIYEGADSEEVAKKMKHIHIIFSNLKAYVNGTHHGVSRKHLQTYLNEFVFRFNRRNTPMSSFNILLGIGSKGRGAEYTEIYRVGYGGYRYIAGL